MKIQNKNTNTSFGKAQVMQCQMKKKSEQEKINATLYKMDLKNGNDLNEMKYSKTAKWLYPDATTDSAYPHENRSYYLLQEDKTGEVISCISISKHFRRGEDNKSGQYILIDGFAQNYKYLNPSEPLFAFVADNAIKHYSKNIIVGTSDLEDETLKKARFTRTKNGEWYMPEKRFTDIIDRAEKRYNMTI